MRALNRRKRGFTLIETVVTIGIVAAMAAVVYPQVVKQFDSADPTRVQNDLKNIQTAIETYNVNVKALPGDLEDLANPIVSDGTASADTTITTSTTLAVLNGNYSTLWNGPYIDKSFVQGDVDLTVATGYGATILDNLVCYASGNNYHGISEGTGTAAANDQACPASSTGQEFIAIQVTGIACSTAAGSQFLALNEMFDGASEATPAANGKIRCVLNASTNKTVNKDVVYYLAVPLG